jgi:nucleoside-diphosphate kinase
MKTTQKIVSALFFTCLSFCCLVNATNFKNSIQIQKPLLEDKINSPVVLSERTFGIIKPDAVQDLNSGRIIELIELNKFTIKAMKKVVLTKKQAEHFYEEHKEQPFYSSLVQYMTSGPVVLLALEKDNAIQDWRDFIGTTDPKQARYGTLRKMFGTSKSSNGLHGSDSPKSAKRELVLFFPELS